MLKMLKLAPFYSDPDFHFFPAGIYRKGVCKRLLIDCAPQKLQLDAEDVQFAFHQRGPAFVGSGIGRAWMGHSARLDIESAECFCSPTSGEFANAHRIAGLHLQYGSVERPVAKSKQRQALSSG
jgi:hypothetical protein